MTEASEPKILRKDTWRASVSTAPKPHYFEALGGTVFLRMRSSGRIFALEKKFPTNADGKCADPIGFMREAIADAIVDDKGEPIFSPDDLRDDERIPPGTFWELWDAVGGHLGIKRKDEDGKKDPEKNSAPANGSPSG